jgi:hypothetical protein
MCLIAKLNSAYSKQMSDKLISDIIVETLYEYENIYRNFGRISLTNTNSAHVTVKQIMQRVMHKMKKIKEEELVFPIFSDYKMVSLD